VKVIQVVGSSGSGKTTFIQELAKKLKSTGKTGTIKHLGHHSFILEEGKDTTVHYRTGVSATIGIDDEKSVATIRCNSIEGGLSLLSDLGLDYAIIEGFKKIDLPCIVIGDLETPSCIIRNPQVEDVIANLDGFADYYTVQGLVNGINPGHSIITGSISMKEVPGYMDYDLPDKIFSEIESIILQLPGVVDARCRLSKKSIVQNEDKLLLAFSVDDINDSAGVLSKAISFIEETLAR